MPLIINDNFDCTGETLTVLENVSFIGGTSILEDSTWTITGNLNAFDEVTFAPDSFNGSTWIVDGNFNFAGASGNNLDLEASQDWFLSVTGTGIASYVNVAHSDASGGSTIFAGTSEDEGNNVNWRFANFNIQQALYSLLKADPIVSELTIWPNVVRQGRALPFIDYNVVTSETIHDLAGPIGITEHLINIHVFSHDHTESYTVGNAIEECLDRYSDVVEGLNILNILIVDSLEISEPPANASDSWVYHRVIRLRTFSR